MACYRTATMCWAAALMASMSMYMGQWIAAFRDGLKECFMFPFRFVFHSFHSIDATQQLA